MGCTSVAPIQIEANASKALEIHNQKRACHGSPALHINEELNKLAQEYAEQLAKKQESIKNNLYNNEFLGENIYIYKGKDFSAENMCNAWYEEIKKFDNIYPESEFHFWVKASQFQKIEMNLNINSNKENLINNIDIYEYYCPTINGNIYWNINQMIIPERKYNDELSINFSYLS